MTLLNMTQCYLLSHDLVKDTMPSVSHDLPKYGITLAVSPFTTSRTVNLTHLDKLSWLLQRTWPLYNHHSSKAISFHSSTTFPWQSFFYLKLSLSNILMSNIENIFTLLRKCDGVDFYNGNNFLIKRKSRLLLLTNTTAMNRMDNMHSLLIPLILKPSSQNRKVSPWTSS